MHPIAFHVLGYPIHWYGILVATGFLAGLWTSSLRAPRDGIAPDKILDLGVWLIIGSIVGARLLYVVSYWKESFAGQPYSEVFMIQHGGLVFYGGLIGATLAAMVYAKMKGLAALKVGDILAPGIALGYVFGRMGCLMNGCCYGRYCPEPWAIHFPADHSTQGMPVHPTEIYDALLSLCLSLGLAWLYRRKKFDGQVFALYLIGYALTRSFVEYFRGDYPPEMHYLGGWATPAQVVSIGILGVGVILWYLAPRPNPKRLNAEG